MTMEPFGMNTRIALVAYFIAYFAFAIVWRSYRVWKTTGVNPYVLPDTNDAYGYIGKWFRLLMVATAAAVACIAATGNLPAGFSPWVGAAEWKAAGWLLLIVSFAWIVVAQRQMGRSWRIGIDTAHRTPLVTSGLFGLSRNPIFLAMRSTLLGLLMVVPSFPTLMIFIVGEILMQIQVRLEEQFLLAQHGAAYAAYCDRVRRWM